MPESDTARRPHPFDALITDPTRMPPLCAEPEFAQVLEGMVADAAPRVFAIVHEYGERVDARIAAWGLAFEERAVVAGVRGGTFMSLQSPEFAKQAFGMGNHVHARLVWVNPDAATPDDEFE